MFIIAFIGLLDHENIGVDTKIIILGGLEVEILAVIDFIGGHLGKWRKVIVRPNFFLATLDFCIPGGLLNNLVPHM